MLSRHDKTHFFKYVDTSAAKQILKSRKLQWKEPGLFNDPFDHNTGFKYQFNKEDMLAELSNTFDRIMFGETGCHFKVRTNLGSMLQEMRQKLVQVRSKLPAEEIKKFRTKVIEAVLSSQDKLPFLENQSTFRRFALAFINQSRTICFSEIKDNNVMWSHYADQHRGAVLGLKCMKEIDDNFLIAMPVKYSKEFPPFTPLDRWVREMTGEEEPDFKRLYFPLIFTKHIDWAYEKEWRISLPLQPNEKNSRGIYLEHKNAEVFDSVYLGCRMSVIDKDEIIAIAKATNPKVSIYQGRMSDCEFNLEFEKMDGDPSIT